MELPKILNRSEIIAVDMTPNNTLPIRILEAYLDKTREKWETNSEEHNILYEEMNKHQDERAEILKQAIKTLRRFMK